MPIAINVTIVCLVTQMNCGEMAGQIELPISLGIALVWVRGSPISPKIGVLCIFESCYLHSQKQWRYPSDINVSS